MSIILVSDGAVELLSVWRGAELHTDPRFATLAARVAHTDELVAAVNDLLGDVDVAEVCETLDAFGIPVARVNALDEVADDEQVRHLGSIIETEHPVGGPMRLARPPVPFGGVRLAADAFPRTHAPMLGHDGPAVFEALGIDEATRARLADRDAANAEILAAMLAAQADGDPGA